MALGDLYQLWFTVDDEGAVTAVLEEIEADEQHRLIGAQVFAPYQTRMEICNWVWARLSLDIAVVEI